MIPANQPLPPIAADLKQALTNRLAPWNLNFELFNRVRNQPNGSDGGSYKICEVLNTDPEFQFVLRYFMHNKPSGYGIKRIVCIHDPDQTRSFEGRAIMIDREAADEKPQWPKEPYSTEKGKVIQRWKAMTDQFSPIEVKTQNTEGKRAVQLVNVKVLPLWHGTKEEICLRICKLGFKSDGKHHYFNDEASPGPSSSTDEGYFGSGIYFTNSAGYATKYSQGYLMLAWVSMREPYPVISDTVNPKRKEDIADIRKLKGLEHYQNYNAHYIPVRPKAAGSLEYYPCHESQIPECDEVVVFEKTQALPRFWIELCPNSPQSLNPFFSDGQEEYQKGLDFTKKDPNEENLKNAFLCFYDAATQGHPEAQFALANFYYKGFYISKDYEMAINWYQRAYNTQKELLRVTIDLQKTAKQQEHKQAPPYPTISTQKPTPIALQPTLPAIPPFAFGKEKWETYFGEIGEEPPLPSNIMEILESRCPFWPGKLVPNKVKDTHMLVLVPQAVNGAPLTLRELNKLVHYPRFGTGAALEYKVDAYDLQYMLDHPPLISHWVLMTRETIPQTENLVLEGQQSLLKGYCQKSMLPINTYQTPYALDALACIFMEYFRTKKRLYSNLYTRCIPHENYGIPWVIGNFRENAKTSGLHFARSTVQQKLVGMAALRKLT